MTDTILNIEADLHLDFEIQQTSHGIVLKFATFRQKRRGGYEKVYMNVKVPRDSITRIVSQVRKLHDRERAAINDDLMALTHA